MPNSFARVVGLAKTLSNELGATDPGELVSPGYTRTGRLDELVEVRAQRPAAAEQVLADMAQDSVGRVAEPAELAAVVAFLCSERASMSRRRSRGRRGDPGLSDGRSRGRSRAATWSASALPPARRRTARAARRRRAGIAGAQVRAPGAPLPLALQGSVERRGRAGHALRGRRGEPGSSARAARAGAGRSPVLEEPARPPPQGVRRIQRRHVPAPVAEPGGSRHVPRPREQPTPARPRACSRGGRGREPSRPPRAQLSRCARRSRGSAARRLPGDLAGRGRPGRCVGRRGHDPPGTDEPPYRIGCMLWRLRRSGVRHVRGVVFGDMRGCSPPLPRRSGVLLEALAGLGGRRPRAVRRPRRGTASRCRWACARAVRTALR